MISGTNTLLKDAIIVLSLRNMFLSIGKIGHEGPSIIMEDLEHWFEFTTLVESVLKLYQWASFQVMEVGAVQSATHIKVQYLIFLVIVVKRGIPLTYIMLI